MLQSPGILRISITKKAAEKIKIAMEKQGKSGSVLRLFISGGGCSGFQYGLTFDRKNDDDQLIESHGVSIIVDQESAKCLDGSEIDYEESVMGEGFKVNNPNATETCGCGHSFKPNH
jgi:iron-sulfur cluster assembly accessory protein